MHLKRLLLLNWMCFRGEHRLELEPKAYAVFAQHEADRERSNWLGKTAFLEAVRFLLTGEHRHRYEDEWITRDEDEGRVIGVFSDGTTVGRTRRRGKSTQLHAQLDPGALPAKGDPAQQLIERAMGLTPEDFAITCYLEQRQTSRLVTADPAERTKYVAGWLQLEKLKEAEAYNARELAQCIEEVQRCEQRLETQEGQYRFELTLYEGKTLTPEQLRRALESAGKELEKAHAESADAAAMAERGRMQRLDAVRADEYGDLLRELKPLVEQLEKANVGELCAELESAQAAERTAHQTLVTRQREEKQKLQVARGEFDGKCPVAGIDCPATQQINRDVKKNAKAHADARVVTQTAHVAHEAAQRVLRAAEAKVGEHQRLEARVKALQERARANLRGQDAWATKRGETKVDEAQAQRAHEHAQQRVVEMTATAERLAERYARATALERAIEETKKKLADARVRAQPLREAALILGPRGAQRRVAEGSLARIEAGANARLAGAGVDLQVGVRWESEGKQLARTCYECGWPFPESERVKECTRCQAKRGPNIVNRLEFVPSSQSGGADDFAAIALQFSASQWLRARREAAWAMALMDEPTAQMDAANRRAFARMLRQEEAFEQILVVAHHQATLDALPGRIQITAGPGGSKVEVTA